DAPSFVAIFASMAAGQVERWCTVEREVPIDAAAAMTRTPFEIIVEAMLGGSASLDADRYSRALTDYFDTIPWHIIYAMFSIPDWMPYPHRCRAMQSRDFCIGIFAGSSSPGAQLSPRNLIYSTYCSPRVTTKPDEA